MKIDLSKSEIWIIVISGLAISLLPILFTRNGWIIFDTNTGVIGDTIGGTTAPFLGFFGSVLIYLALKAQIAANDEIKNQFSQQQIDSSTDFTFSNYKERINLIIKEINSFNISFHENTLIADIKKIDYHGKKYNFIGIQAINLYLIEYFRLHKQAHEDNLIDMRVNSSFQSIFLNINNLIALFYRTHNEIISSKLSEGYKQELEELLKYTYYSKLNYFLQLYIENDPQHRLKIGVGELYDYYKIRV